MANSTNPARGMRDFLPADVRKRNYVINIIKEVYEKYGFEPLETPSVENLETLTGKYGEEGNQLMFKILKRGEKLQQELEEGKIKSENQLSDLALRYDLTVPLARVVANYKNELPKFFKRYQIQPVWRADRPAKGRYREFYQCDVDAIGSSSMMVEAELISAVCEILEKLGFEDFIVRINHRNLLSKILEAASIPSQQHIDVLTALDKIDKIGREGVAKEFDNRRLSADSGNKLLELFEPYILNYLTLEDTNKFTEEFKILIKRFQETDQSLEEFQSSLQKRLETITEPRLRGHWFENAIKNFENLEYFSPSKIQIEEERRRIEQLKSSIVELRNENIFLELIYFIQRNNVSIQEVNEELEDILKLLPKESIKSRIRIDPTLARGLSYYTGAIMEIAVSDFAGSLGGGGRYDGLIGMFGKEQIPAVGFSIGLERIIYVMEERGMFPENLTANSADVMITLWNEESAGESLKLASELREKGLRVLVYPEANKLGKQFKYADSLGIPFVCILGDTELADKKVSVKNLKSGEQETVSREEVAEKLVLSH